MAQVKFDDRFSYEIVENGYDVYSNGTLIMERRDAYAKLYDPDGTYEDNAKLEILNYINHERYCTSSDPILDLAGLIEYIAMMTDVELPE